MNTSLIVSKAGRNLGKLVKKQVQGKDGKTHTVWVDPNKNKPVKEESKEKQVAQRKKVDKNIEGKQPKHSEKDLEKIKEITERHTQFESELKEQRRAYGGGPAIPKVGAIMRVYAKGKANVGGMLGKIKNIAEDGKTAIIQLTSGGFYSFPLSDLQIAKSSLMVDVAKARAVKYVKRIENAYGKNKHRYFYSMQEYREYQTEQKRIKEAVKQQKTQNAKAKLAKEPKKESPKAPVTRGVRLEKDKVPTHVGNQPKTTTAISTEKNNFDTMPEVQPEPKPSPQVPKAETLPADVKPIGQEIEDLKKQKDAETKALYRSKPGEGTAIRARIQEITAKINELTALAGGTGVKQERTPIQQKIADKVKEAKKKPEVVKVEPKPDSHEALIQEQKEQRENEEFKKNNPVKYGQKVSLVMKDGTKQDIQVLRYGQGQIYGYTLDEKGKQKKSVSFDIQNLSGIEKPQTTLPEVSKQKITEAVKKFVEENKKPLIDTFPNEPPLSIEGQKAQTEEKKMESQIIDNAQVVITKQPIEIKYGSDKQIRYAKDILASRIKETTEFLNQHIENLKNNGNTTYRNGNTTVQQIERSVNYLKFIKNTPYAKQIIEDFSGKYGSASSFYSKLKGASEKYDRFYLNEENEELIRSIVGDENFDNGQFDIIYWQE